jgi:hypothetical protein
LRVLLLDSDAASAEHVRLALGKCPRAHYELTPVRGMEEAIHHLGQVAYDAMLLGQMAEDTGTVLDGLLQALDKAPWLAALPVLAEDQCTRLEAALLGAGAEDVLSREESACTPVLSRAIRSAVQRRRSEARRRSAQGRLLEKRRAECLHLAVRATVHGLNNLLVVLLGNAELALHDLPPSSPIRELVEELSEASHCATNRVHRLAAHVRAMRSKLGALDLGSVVAESIHLLEGGVCGRGELTHAPTGGGCWIPAESAQIRQLVLGLIDSGLRSREGEHHQGPLELRTGRAGPDGRYIELELRGARMELDPASRLIVERHRGRVEAATESHCRGGLRVLLPGLGSAPQLPARATPLSAT